LFSKQNAMNTMKSSGPRKRTKKSMHFKMF